MLICLRCNPNHHIKEYSKNLVVSSHTLLDLLDEVLEAIQVNLGEIPKLKKKFSLVKTLNQVIKLNRTQSPEPQQWFSANNLRYK
ncbi:hypothetical protein SC371_03540 [Legionella pneumophila serogroup 2]|nr:hypothetical protein [Legionella pneumophila]